MYYRYYLKRTPQGYVPLDMPGKFMMCKRVYQPKELFNPTAPFVEIKLTVTASRTVAIVSVEELFVDSIRPEAIKAANDQNNFVMIGKTSTNKIQPENPHLMRNKFQEVVDRMRLYGPEFEKELNSVLEKYPLKITMADNIYRVVQKA